MVDPTALLPKLVKCSSIAIIKEDLLISVSGFEERSWAIFEVLDEQSNGKGILIDYLPFDERNNTSLSLSKLQAKGINITGEDIVIYDRFNPSLYTQMLRIAILKKETKHVVLDISAMSKLAIILTLLVCEELGIRLTLFYAEAKEYGPSESAYIKARTEGVLHQPSMQVYTGVQCVIRVSELTSVAMQGQPIAVIAFMSLNEQLTQALLNTLFPSNLFLINGRPPKLKWREEATAWLHEQVRLEWPETDNVLDKKGMPLRVTSTLNYVESLQCILKLYWEIAADKKVVLAPTGSKMQAVASFFAKVLHPDIHIEYPTPKGFLDLYSKGVGSMWKIEMGVLSNLISQIKYQERKQKLSIPL